MNKKTIESLKSALWFLIKLNIFAIPLYLITFFGLSFPSLQNLWALALGQSLSSFGYETIVLENMIGIKSGFSIHQIELSWDSTGWKSLYALAALVFASGKRTIRGKLRFLSFGLPLIIFMNLLRILTTVLFSLSFGFELFRFVHDILWGVLMIAFVLGIWYYLFFRETDNKR